MNHISSRQLRIIPGSPTATPSSTSKRRFDFAALARGRTHRNPTTRSDAPAPYDSDAGLSPAPPSESCLEAPPQADKPTNSPTAPLAEPPDGNPVMEPAACAVDSRELFEHVRHAIAPAVSVIVERQEHFLQIVGMLSREIGAFCGDSAIVSAGNWEVQMTLDPELLPHTTLHVALSRFNIRLRFDVPDRETRDLLLTHSDLLERELDKVVRSWGEARDIQLSVW
ncbi:type III secretion system protein SctP [Burkholderia sp. BE17]|uniref:type III secretion system protein SctP n=1 Tax=Burkholderia sp. BE17 TaxID=2656644 RepID=UPI00128B65E3|nr:type III secretion system protein SctP [Burkholderia sp. BE17]MPV67770.1 type III secretion protein HpaP [Burkholderia sp. BE17]